MRRLAVRAWGWGVLGLFVLGALPGVGVAQRAVADFHSSRIGVGYAGLLPAAPVGAGAWAFIGRSRIGVFINGKATVPSLTNHANYCPAGLQQCLVSWVQSNRLDDVAIGDDTEWLTFTGGGMYAVTAEVALMLGAGGARRTEIREFVDTEEANDLRITHEGNYFVPHAPEPSWEANAFVGVLIRGGNRLAFSFGYETAPGGVVAGLYFMFP